MVNVFKFVPLVALGKDIKLAYIEETGKDRPFYLSRRFIGSVITFVGVGLAIYFNIDISRESLNSITDNIEKVISIATVLYGTGLTIWGAIKRKKRGCK